MTIPSTSIDDARRAVLDANAELASARDAQACVAARVRAVRSAWSSDRERLADLQHAVLAAFLEGSETADPKRREFDDLQSRAAFMRRAVEWARLHGEADARAAVLRAELAVREANELVAEAESSAHDAKLQAILHEAASLNGEIRVVDGGKSEALKLAIYDARRATAEARRALRTFEREVADSREKFTKEQQNV